MSAYAMHPPPLPPPNMAATQVGSSPPKRPSLPPTTIPDLPLPCPPCPLGRFPISGTVPLSSTLHIYPTDSRRRVNSTQSSPSSSSSNSVVFVSAEGIPEYIRDNRAVLVATSAGSPSSSSSLDMESLMAAGARASRVSSAEGARSGTGTRDVAYRLHCRICLRDPCEDMTATICGHLFCKRCVPRLV